MTTRLLRLANSIMFNPGGSRINTISRAIILLGFNTVRDLCLSIALVDTILSGPNREGAIEQMAIAFHAAMQARKLAELSRLPDTEEIFIATLLSHLGDLALLCARDGLGDLDQSRLRKARRLEPAERDLIEREVLGFPVRDLSAALNREWRLSSLLGTVLDGTAPRSARTQVLHFGNALALSMLGGPGNPKLAEVLDQVARDLHLDRSQLTGQVWNIAHSAADTFLTMGVPAAARLVPKLESSGGAPGKVEAETAQPYEGDAPASSNHLLQLNILRDVSHLLIESKPSVNLLMDLILEGIFRGIGMDRAIFALLTADRRLLRIKASLLAEGAALPEPFEFPISASGHSPFELALRTDEPLWLGSLHGGPLLSSLDSRIRALCNGQCFIMPLSIGSTTLGCLYADRRSSGRPLTDELFSQFRLFGQQARLGLSFIKSR